MSYHYPTQFDESIFRAYDIRGVVDEQLTENLVYAIGLAIGSEAAQVAQQTVAVGRDGRLSGPRLVEALIQGIRDSGRDVVFIGQVPSPVLYFATNHLDTRTGVMLTGSHNPSNYNGIKIVMNGKTLSAGGIQAIKNRIIEQNFSYGEGELSEHNVIPAYIDDIAKRVPLQRPLKVVLDCGNGAGGETAAPVFRALGCEVIELFCEVDGNFPNHHPDPAVPENLKDLQAAVAKHNADCGFAFDGDADRVGLITDQGEIIWPDRLMMLCAQEVLQRYPNAPVVFDVKCSANLAKVIAAAGGDPVMYKTGHSILKAKMVELNCPIAGELSGHIFYKDNWYGFDDGVYVAARLAQIFAADLRTVSEIMADLPDSVNTPELKVAIMDDKKAPVIRALQEADYGVDAKVITIDGVRVEYPYGWGLVRASNTTPCLTVRFEADDEAALKQVVANIKMVLTKVAPQLTLDF